MDEVISREHAPKSEFKIQNMEGAGKEEAPTEET